MTEIHELDDATVKRIAAGEVVERPASVVKELVENSLDADATRIDVSVSNGGIDRIRVADNGIGMSQAEARLAVRKHTTSKITDLEDLEAGIGTLGFRGEALDAIGAVSTLTVRTRPHGDDRGTELVVEDGDIVSTGPVGCPEGTVVTVENLFETVPARRKYLKKPSTEFAHINRVVTSYALANADVAVSLEHGDRETFATPGQGDLRSAVLSVYGREVATAMIPVETDTTDGPLEAIDGLVSHPETTRATRDYLSTFVNGRYVTSSTVREAIISAYGTQLAPDRYPFTVLFITAPAETVDVNVHPRKLQVRFVDDAGVREQVQTAVTNALLEEGLLRSSAPRGRSAPAQTEINPDRHDTASDTPDSGDPSAPRTAGTDRDSDRHGGRPTDTDPAAMSGTPEAAETGEPGRPTTDIPPADGPDQADPHTGLREAADQATLAEGTVGERREYEALPTIRLLGQFQDTYIVGETADGLVLVDQHAADERVRYERLRAQFADDVTTQLLAEPVDVELTAREAELFDQHQEALARVGVRASRTDDRTVTARTVPARLADADASSLIPDLLGACIRGDPADTVSATADAILADMACHPSVTANTSLTEGRTVDLLAALDECDNPWACPHGRPTIVEFGTDEIEGRFERDYPGHTTRRKGDEH